MTNMPGLAELTASFPQAVRHRRRRLWKLALLLWLAAAAVLLHPGLAEICGQPGAYACGP